MNLQDARAVAKHEAAQFGQTYVVYRFTGWPDSSYGVRAHDQKELLPMDAVIIERIDPDGSSRSATSVPVGKLF